MRKAKGLCFNCDKKFTPSHRCANIRLLLLQWNEGSQENSLQDDTEYVVELEENSQVDDQSSKSSLNAMNCQALIGTLRFYGIVNGYPVEILLDGESDDSFTQPRLAKLFNLEIQPTKPIKVLVGNRQALQVKGMVAELPIKVMS